MVWSPTTIRMGVVVMSFPDGSAPVPGVGVLVLGADAVVVGPDVGVAGAE